MLLDTFKSVAAPLFEILRLTLWVPLVTLPMRGWRPVFGWARPTTLLVRAFAPWIAVGGAFAVWRLAYRAALVSHVGAPRGWLTYAVGALLQVAAIGLTLASRAQAFIWALHPVLPWVAALLMGAVLWLSALFLCTVFGGPVYLIVSESRVREALASPLVPAVRQAVARWAALLRGAGQRRHAWLVGLQGPALPVYVDLDEAHNVWVFGGRDRRTNGAPLLGAVRAYVSRGRPLIFIDTVGSHAVAEQLQALAEAADAPFSSWDVSREDLTAPMLQEAYSRKAIVYVGLPMQRDSDAMPKSALQLFERLHAAATGMAADAQWILAVQDSSELPGECLLPILRQPAFRLLVAQGRCDASAIALPAVHNVLQNSTVVVLTPRTPAEAQALTRSLRVPAASLRRLTSQGALVFAAGALRAALWRIDSVPRPGHG